MYTDKLKKLCVDLGCEYLENALLSQYTTFKIGGKCRAVVRINSADSLIALLELLKSENEPYQVLGKGSNVIVSDSGYDGIVLLMGQDFSDISLENDTDIRCKAGASLSRVCSFALKNGLSGLEFAYGIPGTAGGALFMNAGAYGGEMKDVVVSAEYINDKSERIIINSDDMELSYRSSIFAKNPSFIITELLIHLEKGDPEKIQEKMQELMEKRREKQPLEYPSAGSTFKRPEGSYASLLIDQCGLKGLSVGGAEVSVKHSGFIVNKGGATAKDILSLADEVVRIVKEKTGYTLELEPRLLGN